MIYAELLKKDPDPEGRITAIERLGGKDLPLFPGVRQALAEAFASDPNIEVRVGSAKTWVNRGLPVPENMIAQLRIRIERLTGRERWGAVRLLLAFLGPSESWSPDLIDYLSRLAGEDDLILVGYIHRAMGDSPPAVMVTKESMMRLIERWVREGSNRKEEDRNLWIARAVRWFNLAPQPAEEALLEVLRQRPSARVPVTVVLYIIGSLDPKVISTDIRRGMADGMYDWTDNNIRRALSIIYIWDPQLSEPATKAVVSEYTTKKKNRNFNISMYEALTHMDWSLLPQEMKLKLLAAARKDVSDYYDRAPASWEEAEKKAREFLKAIGEDKSLTALSTYKAGTWFFGELYRRFGKEPPPKGTLNRRIDLSFSIVFELIFAMLPLTYFFMHRNKNLKQAGLRFFGLSLMYGMFFGILTAFQAFPLAVGILIVMGALEFVIGSFKIPGWLAKNHNLSPPVKRMLQFSFIFLPLFVVLIFSHLASSGTAQAFGADAFSSSPSFSLSFSNIWLLLPGALGFMAVHFLYNLFVPWAVLTAEIDSKSEDSGPVSKIESLIKEVFPNQQILRATRWTDPQTRVDIFLLEGVDSVSMTGIVLQYTQGDPQFYLSLRLGARSESEKNYSHEETIILSGGANTVDITRDFIRRIQDHLKTPSDFEREEVGIESILDEILTARVRGILSLVFDVEESILEAEHPIEVVNSGLTLAYNRLSTLGSIAASEFLTERVQGTIRDTDPIVSEIFAILAARIADQNQGEVLVLDKLLRFVKGLPMLSDPPVVPRTIKRSAERISMLLHTAVAADLEKYALGLGAEAFYFVILQLHQYQDYAEEARKELFDLKGLSVRDRTVISELFYRDGILKNEDEVDDLAGIFDRIRFLEEAPQYANRPFVLLTAGEIIEVVNILKSGSGSGEFLPVEALNREGGTPNDDLKDQQSGLNVIGVIGNMILRGEVDEARSFRTNYFGIGLKVSNETRDGVQRWLETNLNDAIDDGIKEVVLLGLQGEDIAVRPVDRSSNIPNLIGGIIRLIESNLGEVISWSVHINMRYDNKVLNILPYREESTLTIPSTYRIGRGILEHIFGISAPTDRQVEKFVSFWLELPFLFVPFTYFFLHRNEPGQARWRVAGLSIMYGVFFGFLIGFEAFPLALLIIGVIGVLEVSIGLFKFSNWLARKIHLAPPVRGYVRIALSSFPLLTLLFSLFLFTPDTAQAFGYGAVSFAPTGFLDFPGLWFLLWGALGFMGVHFFYNLLIPWAALTLNEPDRFLDMNDEVQAKYPGWGFFYLGESSTLPGYAMDQDKLAMILSPDRNDLRSEDGRNVLFDLFFNTYRFLTEEEGVPPGQRVYLRLNQSIESPQGLREFLFAFQERVHEELSTGNLSQAPETFAIQFRTGSESYATDGENIYTVLPEEDILNEHLAELGLNGPSMNEVVPREVDYLSQVKMKLLNLILGDRSSFQRVATPAFFNVNVQGNMMGTVRAEEAATEWLLSKYREMSIRYLAPFQITTLEGRWSVYYSYDVSEGRANFINFFENERLRPHSTGYGINEEGQVGLIFQAYTPDRWTKSSYYDNMARDFFQTLILLEHNNYSRAESVILFLNGRVVTPLLENVLQSAYSNWRRFSPAPRPIELRVEVRTRDTQWMIQLGQAASSWPSLTTLSTYNAGTWFFKRLSRFRGREMPAQEKLHRQIELSFSIAYELLFSLMTPVTYFFLHRNEPGQARWRVAGLSLMYGVFFGFLIGFEAFPLALLIIGVMGVLEVSIGLFKFSNWLARKIHLAPPVRGYVRIALSSFPLLILLFSLFLFTPDTAQAFGYGAVSSAPTGFLDLPSLWPLLWGVLGFMGVHFIYNLFVPGGGIDGGERVRI